MMMLAALLLTFALLFWLLLALALIPFRLLLLLFTLLFTLTTKRKKIFFESASDLSGPSLFRISKQVSFNFMQLLNSLDLQQPLAPGPVPIVWLTQCDDAGDEAEEVEGVCAAHGSGHVLTSPHLLGLLHHHGCRNGTTRETFAKSYRFSRDSHSKHNLNFNEGLKFN